MNKVLYAGTLILGDLAHDQDWPIVFPADIKTGNYYVMGTMVSNTGSADIQADTLVHWSIRGRTSTGFMLHTSEQTANGQNMSFEYILFAK